MTSMTKADELRREGRAEAVVRIVLSRKVPMISADDWCDVLDVKPTDVKAAMERLSPKARAARPKGNPGIRYSACPFCAERVMVGKRWVDHMAARHPGKWETLLEERYQPTCPDCGEPIHVRVTVERHTCRAEMEVAS